MNGIASQLERLIEPVVVAMGYELWGCDLHQHSSQSLLRVYIDREEGVTLDDCARISHQVSGLLDVHDPIKVQYTLEVSSPGMNRPLFKPKHYEMYKGSKLKIKLRWMVDGRQNFNARLEDANQHRITVNQDGEMLELPMEAIVASRIIPEY